MSEYGEASDNKASQPNAYRKSDIVVVPKKSGNADGGKDDAFNEPD